MEYSASIIDPCDELQKLKDKVKRLEKQNEQLRSQTSNRNGLIEKLDCDTFAGTGDDAKLDVKKSSSSLDGCQVIEIDKEDYLDHDGWLLKTVGNQLKDAQQDFQAVLQHDINSNQNEFHIMRRNILQRIGELKQASLKSIDTRTYTRPKKRFTRPPLETMLETPLLENRQLMSSPWFAKKNMQFLGDNIEDVSMMLDSTLSSLTSEPENANQTFCASDFTSINSPVHITSGTQGNSTYHLNAEHLLFNTSFPRLSGIGQANQRNRKDQGNINATNVLTQDHTFLNMTRSVHLQQDSFDNTGRNCTFAIRDGGGSSGSSRRSVCTASCESGLDEDQLSSASDSSYSSASKPMNVGDVQIIADIQEESLKQANSTPVKDFTDGTFANMGEDLPSPIAPSNGRDVNHGYQSDHSDHSSADSRAKSSRSSVRSSPSSSPRGSTNLLSNVNDNAPYQLPTALPNRRLEGNPPVGQRALKKPSALVLRQPENVRSRPASGLRTPSIRAPRVTAVQPNTRPVSGIPRPPSRLPAPRTRSAFAGQPTNKNNVMHGYY